MSYVPEHLRESSGHVVCVINRVVVLLWKEPPTPAGVDDTRQLFRTIIARAPKDKLAFLTVIEPAATALNLPQPVRDRLAAMLKEFQGNIAAATVVVDAEGFRASLVRTFVATMNLANRLEFPSNTEKDLDAAARWLSTRDQQLTVAPLELVDAVRRLRESQGSARR